jgi:hypothetical protein
MGCIIKEVKLEDSDHDGITDAIDKCPNEKGPLISEGCPFNDKDGDGIEDKKDKCPSEKGLEVDGGCPHKEKDQTNETIIPFHKQIKESKIADIDGDGIEDKNDKCPNEKGLASNKGCPVEEIKIADKDGDGIEDKKDKCPSEKGLATDGGCPKVEIKIADKDGDGVEDKKDRCPNEKGLATDGGCPTRMIKIDSPYFQYVINGNEVPIVLPLSFSYVEGGSFEMGCTKDLGGDCFDDEKPSHIEKVDNFYISKYEVTQFQWQFLMGENPSTFKGCMKCPVDNIKWDDVQKFIKKLNNRTGMKYRLPTEIEWEYAARGGNKSKGYYYAGSDNLGAVGLYNDNSGSKTAIVGSKNSNELGLFDMSGNVIEWTDTQENESIILRGGGWLSESKNCRVSNRRNANPDDRYNDVGFRLAASVSEN